MVGAVCLYSYSYTFIVHRWKKWLYFQCSFAFDKTSFRMSICTKKPIRFFGYLNWHVLHYSVIKSGILQNALEIGLRRLQFQLQGPATGNEFHFFPLKNTKPPVLFITVATVTTVYWVNSLWPSDAIWRHRSGSTLAWRHQAITWTNVGLSSVRSSYIHLMAISQEMHQPSITTINSSEISFKSHRSQWVKSHYFSLPVFHVQAITWNLCNTSHELSSTISDV